MEVLEKTRTYLVGHMQYSNGRNWRDHVEEELEKLNITVFNPYKKPFVKDVNEDEETRLSLDHCQKHGYFNDVAERMKKPIFISMEGGKHKTPLWIMGMLPHHYIYNSIEEVLDMIHQINDGKKDIDSDRWRLLRKDLR